MAFVALFREMWRYVGRDRWKIVVYVALHVLASLCQLATPLVFAQVLNSLQTAPDAATMIRHVAWWTGAWAGVYVLFNLLHRAGRWFEFDVAYRLKQTFLNRYYRLTTEIPLKWHTDHHSGATIDRINLAAVALHEFSLKQFVYIGQIMTFVGSLVALAIISWRISILSLAVSIATIASIQAFDKRLVKSYATLNEVNHRISAAFFDYVSNIKTIITLRLGERTGRELDARIGAGYTPFMHAETWVNAWKWFTVTLFMVALQVGTIFYYIWLQLTQTSRVLIGNVAAVLQYLEQLSGTFGGVAAEYQQIIHWQQNYRAVRMIDEAVPADAAAAHQAFEWREIAITHLTFAYQEATTLDDVSIAFKRGERVALVGESGSGKSSLMALMRGLYEAKNMQLTIDGTARPTLAGITTLIPQEPEIFENTIRYNITVGLDYPEQAVRDALRLSRFDKVVERLPAGLDTDVREKGVTLSGGERQRLALARGILAAANSSLILMDEPTSSVDAHNEMSIYENIFAAFPQSTIVSSIHRLHLLSRFDRIVVMAAGRVVQTGTFATLKDAPGLFGDLWARYVDSSATTAQV
jgi:ATP-binding cassette subfamily B protein